MSEEKKLAKRLRMFRQFDEATIVAEVTTTTMDYRDLKAANEGMERLYNICTEIDEISAEMTTQAQFRPQNEPKNKFSIYSWINSWKILQNLHFARTWTSLKLELQLSLFSKSLLRDFNFQLRDSYLAENDNFQEKINRVNLLLAQDRGFIWNQEQSAHDPKDNWKEGVRILGYSYRCVANCINFFHRSTIYPRILTSSA